MRPIVVVKDVGAEVSQQEKQRNWGETLRQVLGEVRAPEETEKRGAKQGGGAGGKCF